MLGISAICFPAGGQFISNTKHNLSKSGSYSIKSGAETEICVFCHIPHGAKAAIPLWSQEMTTSSYTAGQLYDSDYLYRFGYTLPTTLGSLPNEAGYISRLCLSCHDGTVALGSVTMLRGISATPGTPIIGDVSGTGTTAHYLSAQSSAYIGTNLKDDHPIAIQYDATKTKSFGSGTRTIELNNSAPSINPSPPYPRVQLHKPSGGNVQGHVECTSCHDPHNDTNGQFLAAAKLNGTLCTTCHQKAGWGASIHKTSGAAINNPGGDNMTIPGNTLAEAACLACHKSHSGNGTPYLLRKIEENSCFNGTSTSCHSSSATTTKNIESVITKTYKHPATTIGGVHTNLDVLYPTGGTPAGSKGLQWSDSKHSECVDCHNPHKASNTPARLAGGSWYPASVDSTSNQTAKSGALIGVTGIDPGVSAGGSTTVSTPASWPAKWTQVSTYRTLESAGLEYQICLKCHSSYALGNASSTPISTYSSLSDPTNVYFTDVAWEINPNNMSGHSLVTGLSNFPNASAPKALSAAQMKSPWNTSLGTQTMYCSDCHGADAETSTDTKGPHGSNRKFMLKGAGQYWPKKSDYATYWRLNITDGADANMFCNNCHPVYSGAWQNNVHSSATHVANNYACVECHVVVPHGTKRSRLIGYSYNVSDTATIKPYNDNNSMIKIQGFKKAAGPTSYIKTDCVTTCHTPNGTNCGSSCDP